MGYGLAVNGLMVIVASLLTGLALSLINITSEQVLKSIGLTTEELLQWLTIGMNWAAANILVGSIVIVPIWIIVSLSRPPRR